MTPSKTGLLRQVLDILAAAGMLVASVAIVWTTIGRPWWQERQRTAAPSGLVSLAGLPTLSKPDARIALIEFADYQCPYCKTFERDVMPDLKERYILTGKIAFAFSQFPIENLHPATLDASAVAECAHREGKFWPVHKRMFDVIGKDSLLATFSEAAVKDGVTPEFLKLCLDGGVRDEVRRQVREATRLGIASTPTFYLGSFEAGSGVKVRKVLVGYQSLDSLSKALDGVLVRFGSSQ